MKYKFFYVWLKFSFILFFEIWFVFYNVEGIIIEKLLCYL